MVTRKTQTLVPIAGSVRAPLPGAKPIGAVNPREKLRLTIVVRRRPGQKGMATKVNQLCTRAVATRDYLSREGFEEALGADPEDMKAVKKFAADSRLQVVECDAAQRRVVVIGTVAAVSNAFGIHLAQFQYGQSIYRGRTGAIHVPAELSGVVEGVLGLDDRPQAGPHFRGHPLPKGMFSPRTVSGTFLPTEVASLYNFPPEADGTGQCIAIIELGGGYRSSDLKTYFKQLGLPQPKVYSKSIDGAKNKPIGDFNSADGEVVLDIEVAGAAAPKATIVVYFAPNTDAGFLNAVSTAIHDEIHKPSVVSISWGAAEAKWTIQAMQAMDQAFQDAAALGVTICCASGDDGSRDGVQDDQVHVDFPASSPFVLACGGTRLLASANQISSEVVWNNRADGGATGGGVSEVFPLPTWQKDAGVPPSANSQKSAGRGVPDVAGNADPQTGYRVLVDGVQGVVGGTSAVAPLWAALIARLNQQLGKPVGYLNPILYKLPAESKAFRDIVSGDNNVTQSAGPYPARKGWDACCGLGTPVGARLASLL